ncbi:MAG TPA: hypothetical protein PLM58_14870 [Novosphingobium sp.]|nr:hypothetical protein [Novosphingobium sp.]
MTTVDPVFAQWLMDQARWHVAEDATLKARWGETAETSERVTTIATKADAEAEAARQMAFLGGPLVEDEHLLMGQWAGHLGQVITLTIDKLGYDAGVDVFVVAVEDDRVTGLSRVRVLRRL